MGMLEELSLFNRALKTRPTEEVVLAAQEAATVVGNNFSSTDEVLASAQLLARIYLSKGDLKDIGCATPMSCVAANLVYTWLHRDQEEHFSVPVGLKKEVLSRIMLWSTRSESCICSYTYLARKGSVDGATMFCLGQHLLAQRENEDVSRENALEVIGS